MVRPSQGRQLVLLFLHAAEALCQSIRAGLLLLVANAAAQFPAELDVGMQVGEVRAENVLRTLYVTGRCTLCGEGEREVGELWEAAALLVLCILRSDTWCSMDGCCW